MNQRQHRPGRRRLLERGRITPELRLESTGLDGILQPGTLLNRDSEQGNRRNRCDRWRRLPGNHPRNRFGLVDSPIEVKPPRLLPQVLRRRRIQSVPVLGVVRPIPFVALDRRDIPGRQRPSHRPRCPTYQLERGLDLGRGRKRQQIRQVPFETARGRDDRLIQTIINGDPDRAESPGEVFRKRPDQRQRKTIRLLRHAFFHPIRIRRARASPVGPRH